MWSFRSISGAFPKVASSWQRAVATTTVRCQPYSNGLKSYPQYNVFGENCMLCMKLLPPVFKYLRNNQTLTLDSNKKGRILLEWIPRNPDGTVSRDRDSVVRFGLAAEEIGLLLRQLPRNEPVEFTRRPAPNESLYDGPSVPHKVCKIIPATAEENTGTVDFIIDFEVDGVGGQQILQSSITTGNPQGPLQVTMQAGEVQVALEIMRTSLPVLVGWSTQQSIAVQKCVDDAVGGGGGGGGHDPYDF